MLLSQLPISDDMGFRFGELCFELAIVLLLALHFLLNRIPHLVSLFSIPVALDAEKGAKRKFALKVRAMRLHRSCQVDESNNLLLLKSRFTSLVAYRL
jgi:hypothetical protein